jgi:hypothetical protein
MRAAMVEDADFPAGIAKRDQPFAGLCQVNWLARE